VKVANYFTMGISKTLVSGPRSTPKELHLSAQGCRTRLPWVMGAQTCESVVGGNPEGLL
jgi:hypothetical protein